MDQQLRRPFQLRLFHPVSVLRRFGMLVPFNNDDSESALCYGPSRLGTI
jgi:hypothetical protein